MAEERRTLRRYALSLPIRVSAPAADGLAWFEGTVRDISSSGVYFLCKKAPNESDQVNLMIDLPPETTGGVNVTIESPATVMRVENRSEDGETRIGVAAVLGRYKLVRHGEATSFRSLDGMS